MSIARSSLAGVATGVVLLAGAVGFGVGLPKVVENPAAAHASGDLPALPDRLDDRMVALAAMTPDDVNAATPELVEQAKAIATSAADSEKPTRASLKGMYGDTAVRLYLDMPALSTALAASQTNPQAQAAAPAQLAVTVLSGDAGAVIPSGPFQSGAEQSTHYELKKLGGYRCSIYSVDATDPLTGQPTGAEPTGANYQVQCRAERDGQAYDAYSTGLTPEETVHYLDRVLELTEG